MEPQLIASLDRGFRDVNTLDSFNNYSDELAEIEAIEKEVESEIKES